MPGVVIKRQATSKALVLDPATRIRVLSEHGSSVKIDKAIPIKRYFRSGSEMERQARVYYTEGQWDRAFMLYNKFATLFIEKLPKHPEYSKALPADKTRIKKLLKQALPRAMELKEKLKEKYDKERVELEKSIQEEEEEETRKREENERIRKQVEDDAAADKADQIAAFFGGQGGVVTTAVESSIEDQSSRASDGQTVTSRSSPPPPSSPPAYQDIKEDAIEQNSGTTPTSDESKTVLNESSPTEQRMETEEESGYTATDPNLAHVLPPTDVTYDPVPTAPPPPVASYYTAPPQSVPPTYDPTLYGGVGSQTQVPVHTAPQVVHPHPALQQPKYEGSLFQSPFTSQQQQPRPLAIPPPPGSPGAYYQPPPPPGGVTGNWSSPPSYSAGPTHHPPLVEEDRVGPPAVDRSTKPDSIKALNTGWSADGYRPVHIPMDAATRFEEVASTNTRRNVETCGILAGKLSQNTLLITHIIVPKQKGQSDSCETLNEEELFDVQDQYDLITLGWIHTHPSQTAFLSSVDLHCHCSYQIMMDEAVAIVVAPKYNQVGYFMLTEPHGLNYITHCEEEGFHMHQKEPPLYEDCKHVHHDSKSFIQIVDLR